MAIHDLNQHPAAWVTMREAAQYFTVSTQTIAKWIAEDKLTRIQPARRVVRISVKSMRRLEETELERP